MNYVILDVDFQCQWRGCGRTKKSVPPFPSVQRLARHVKEVHILKGNGRIIPPSERSKCVLNCLFHQFKYKSIIKMEDLNLYLSFFVEIIWHQKVLRYCHLWKLVSVSK